MKFYKNKCDHICQFLYKVRHEIITNNDFINSKILIQYKMVNNNDAAPLIMFAASYYFNHKYQKIDNIITKTLERKFSDKFVPPINEDITADFLGIDLK